MGALGFLFPLEEQRVRAKRRARVQAVALPGVQHLGCYYHGLDEGELKQRGTTKHEGYVNLQRVKEGGESADGM